MPTPRGLAKLNIAHDRTKAFTFDNILLFVKQFFDNLLSNNSQPHIQDSHREAALSDVEPEAECHDGLVHHHL